MKRITNYKVEYGALKRAIRKSLIQGKGIDFSVDFDLLNANISDLGITAIEYRTKSKHVNPEDVAYLGEFFRQSDLAWINKFRQYSSIVFINNDYIDDEARELMEDIKTPLIDNPDLDKVEIMSTLLSKYPCYIASVISYKSTDTKRLGILCTEVICKANLATIMKDNETYHKPENNNQEAEEETTEEENND